jgi:hypothetical protein
VTIGDDQKTVKPNRRASVPTDSAEAGTGVRVRIAERVPDAEAYRPVVSESHTVLRRGWRTVAVLAIAITATVPAAAQNTEEAWVALTA